MKVSFNAKEYARLLELVHLGLWVAGSRHEDPATMPERYAAIAQKAFALAEPFGCADLVEADVNGQVLIYLNRLSDLLFVLGRVGNNNGRSDVLWTPGRFADRL